MEFLDFVRAGVIAVVGVVLAVLAGRATHRVALRYADVQRAMIARRVVLVTLLALVAVSVLRELGFSLTVLLGAAGVLSVAIGFASQTSASNLISGLFLIAEKPFAIGDVITVGSVTGEVLSIDMLSVKLRTYDNLFVRVPNETLIKSEVINVSRFPIRRYDMQVGVAYKEDLDRTHQLLKEAAAANPFVLEDPEPLVIFIGYAESGITLQLSVWGLRENYLALRNSIARDVKRVFDREGVEIPFPHRMLVRAPSRR
jgi:small-conductance mechanosensitive channel